MQISAGDLVALHTHTFKSSNNVLPDGVIFLLAACFALGEIDPQHPNRSEPSRVTNLFAGVSDGHAAVVELLHVSPDRKVAPPIIFRRPALMATEKALQSRYWIVGDQYLQRRGYEEFPYRLLLGIRWAYYLETLSSAARFGDFRAGECQQRFDRFSAFCFCGCRSEQLDAGGAWLCVPNINDVVFNVFAWVAWSHRSFLVSIGDRFSAFRPVRAHRRTLPATISAASRNGLSLKCA